jgi:hypothetical protein
MKPLPILLLTFALCAAIMLPGCALFGPSVQKAQEVAEKRQDLLNQAATNFEAAGKELEALINEYNTAKATGDTTAIEAIEQVLPSAVAKYKAAEDAYKSALDVYQAAVQDFKDAKSTSDYLGTVFGWITAGLGAVFGGGAMVGRARAREAVEGVTAALEKTKADPAKWPEARTSMQASLSTGALKIIDKLRP